MGDCLCMTMTIACDLHFANYISFLMLMRALCLNVYRADRNEIASKLMSSGLKDDALILNVQHNSFFLLKSQTLVFTCVWNFKYKYMRMPILSL